MLESVLCGRGGAWRAPRFVSSHSDSGQDDAFVTGQELDTALRNGDAEDNAGADDDEADEGAADDEAGEDKAEAPSRRRRWRVIVALNKHDSWPAT